VALEVAHRAVVVAGEARYQRHRVGARYVTAAAANDHGKLALEVQPRGHARTQHGLQVGHLAAGEAHEDQRLRRRLVARFLDVRAVVQADAQDLVGIGYHRQQLELREGPVRFA
jgi:hypothetical protein